MPSIASSSHTEPHSLFPSWLKGKWGNLGVLFTFYIFFDIAWTYFHWGGPQNVILIANLLSLLPSLLASVISWRAAAQDASNKSERRAWFLLGTGFFMFFIGNLVWAYLEVILKVEPFPSLADFFYLASYPLALWGLLCMPDAIQNRRDGFTLWLDLFIVLTAASMFVGYFIIVPTATAGNDLLTQLLAPAYPLSSLLVFGGILVILYRRTSSTDQSSLSLLLIGMLFFVGADLTFGYTSLTGTYTPGGWTDAGWNVAQLFFGLGALRSMVNLPPSAFIGRWIMLRNRLKSWLPPIAVGLSYGLVLYTVILNERQGGDWLIVGVLLLTLLVITRQIVSPAFADLPVRVKVILTSILVSVLSVSLVLATAYLTVRSNLEAVVGDRLKAEVEVRSKTLGNEIGKQLDLLKGLVLGETIEYGVNESNASYSADPSRVDIQLHQTERAWNSAADADPLVQDVLSNAMAQELYDFQNRFPGHDHLLVTDIHGATVAAIDPPGRYSHAQEEWWQEAYNEGKGAVYISPPAFDPDTQTLRVTIAVPIHTDHTQQVAGVLHTSYRMGDILKVATISHSETKIGFDLLLPGGLIIHQGGSLENLDSDTEIRLEASQDTNYSEMIFEEKLQLISQADIASSDPEDANLFNDLNWTLMAHQDHALAFIPLYTVWQTALLTTLVVLFLTTGLAVILAQVLVAPISRLTATAERIAQGDLSTQAQVESQDEIGLLARTFNSMLNALTRTQKELRENEANYRNLVDYSPDMIAVHRDGKYVFINPAGVKLLGGNYAAEIIGKSILDMVPQGDRFVVQSSIENVIASSQPTPLTYRKMVRIDGIAFEAEYRAIPITYAGQPAIQMVARDITERRQAEEQIRLLLAEVERQKGDLEVRVSQRTEELNQLNQRLRDELAERQQLMVSLRDSEERFRLLFDASPDAILVLDPHDSRISWPIVDCNQVACTMNGYTRQELIGQSIDLLHPDPVDLADRQAYLEYLRREGVLHQEGIHRHKDGHIFPIEVSSSITTYAGREFVLGIDRDITPRKQAELALQQAKETAEASQRAAEEASRAKSEFLSRMSHELRTPMNAILGFAQLLDLSRKEPLTATQKERVKQIVKGGQHLLDLINEILDISRIEANRLHISPEPVSIQESIQEALDLTVPLAVKRHIQIVTKWGRMDVKSFVMADRQRLKQVLINLLGNAVKYNYDEGFVIVTCDQTQPTSWRISITDSGPGISQQNLARLFIPFERLGAHQPDMEGTGLGLALAKRLVELMQGRIGVESTVGRGSTFWIELPSAEAPLERLQRIGGTGELPVLSASARTILYIEDNVANFELIRQVLSDYSQIELLWATDAKAGVEVARQRHPDLILLDLHLGGADGNEVLVQLKRQRDTAGIPVVMVSADATPGRKEQAVALGAHSYLTKPLNVKHFMQLIEELLSMEGNMSHER